MTLEKQTFCIILLIMLIIDGLILNGVLAGFSCFEPILLLNFID